MKKMCIVIITLMILLSLSACSNLSWSHFTDSEPDIDYEDEYMEEYDEYMEGLDKANQERNEYEEAMDEMRDEGDY